MTSIFKYVYNTSVSPQTTQNEGYIGNVKQYAVVLKSIVSKINEAILIEFW